MKNNAYTNPTKKWAIVDDEPAVLEVMQALLGSVTPSPVVAFNNPVEAVAAIRAEPQAFEMLITDRNMPQMDGVGLLVLAREAAPHLRFVMVTGNTLRLEEDFDWFGLPHSFVSKPFNRARIADAVSRAVPLGQEPDETFAAPAASMPRPRQPARERQPVDSVFGRTFRAGWVTP